ncbi:MAG: hypothetical protein FVQ83_16385 [Chloroflexi bacterium]|nr:hypothetical protein [Chloroflexota bacterium]
MRLFTLILFVLITGLAAACNSADPAEDADAQEEGVVVVVEDGDRLEALETEVVEPTPEAAGVMYVESLLAALESEGIEVTTGEAISQAFFVSVTLFL